MKKVIIIEDDPYVRKFYERLFKNKEYEVIIAATGEEGIHLAVEYKPSLILLDMVMVPMDGLQVLEILKKQEETKMIPVVMLTNIDDHDSMKEAQQHGADGFMIKAYYEPEELRSHVEKLIGEQ
jgi:DNA-binding response OmpR family regulator